MAESYNQLEPDSTGKKVQMFENVRGGNTVEAMAVVAVDPSGLTDSYVQVAADDTGKKIQYFKNTVGVTEVHAIGVILVDSNGDPL